MRDWLLRPCGTPLRRMLANKARGGPNKPGSGEEPSWKYESPGPCFMMACGRS